MNPKPGRVFMYFPCTATATAERGIQERGTKPNNTAERGILGRDRGRKRGRDRGRNRSCTVAINWGEITGNQLGRNYAAEELRGGEGRGGPGGVGEGRGEGRGAVLTDDGDGGKRACDAHLLLCGDGGDACSILLSEVMVWRPLLLLLSAALLLSVARGRWWRNGGGAVRGRVVM
jgi:hypothetical protein